MFGTAKPLLAALVVALFAAGALPAPAGAASVEGGTLTDPHGDVQLLVAPGFSSPDHVDMVEAGIVAETDLEIRDAG